MEKYLNKVMIVDGSYMIHRALHTPALQELQTTNGTKSGGVFGFMRMLQAEVKRFPGFMPIVCWDKGLSTRRTELYPNYKSNRKRTEADLLLLTEQEIKEQDSYLEEYHKQRDDVIRILHSLGIPSILENGWEGDDLQYLLSKVCEEGIIVSDDKDMIQLVAPNIRIRRAMRDELISWTDSDEFYRHPHFTIYKSIIGDDSDNIPQVAKGVGDKAADQIASLLDKSEEDLDKYKAILEEFASTNTKALGKKVSAVLENWNQFVINYNLINLRLVQPSVGFESMIKDSIRFSIGHPDIMKAYQLIGKYEMNSIFPDQIIFAISPASTTLLKD